MNKVYCYCHFAGVYQCVRTRAHVGVSSGGGGGGAGRGRVGGGGCFTVRVCMCVCGHGRYLKGLTVGGERQRQRESSLCL